MADTIKYPKITFDKSLEKYRGKVLFPESLARANKMLENSNFSKLFFENDSKKLESLSK